MSAKTPVEKKPIRDLLQEKDAFLTTSEKFIEYFLRHTKAFIALGVALAIIIIGTAFYLRHQSNAEAKAAIAFEQAMESAKKSDGSQESRAALEKVRSDYQGRKGARLAGFALIPLYDNAGETDRALTLAEDMLKTLQPAESSLKPLLLNTIGGLSEVKGDFQLAAKSYEALMASSPLPPLKLEVMMALARVYASSGRNDEAVKLYEDVVREFPQSMHALIANFKVAEIKGEAVSLFPVAGLAASSTTPALVEGESQNKSEQGDENKDGAASEVEVKEDQAGAGGNSAEDFSMEADVASGSSSEENAADAQVDEPAGEGTSAADGQD